MEQPAQNHVKQFSEEQQRAIDARGRVLVLAPPGSGKTEILSARIAAYLNEGGDARRVACLTFTNRASREMIARVNTLATADTAYMFVGNIHKFCSDFLARYELLPAYATMLDEHDSRQLLNEILPVEIIASPNLLDIQPAKNHGYTFNVALASSLLNDPEFNFRSEKISDAYYPSLIARMQTHVRMLATLIAQISLNHPSTLWLYPSAMPKGMNASVLTNFIQHPDTLDLGNPQHYLIAKALILYQRKQENALIDFDEVLIRTYTSLKQNAATEFEPYLWVQVDEVQDLNNIQLEIVKLIAHPTQASIAFFGDEQQAIFSFMGAQLENLNALTHFCGNNILRLTNNFRSPGYLVQMLAAYAKQQLHLDDKWLPRTTDNSPAVPNDMLIYEFAHNEIENVASRAVPFFMKKSVDERLAIIVPTNSKADEMSEALTQNHIEHLKISGSDIFKSPKIKALRAMLMALVNENNLAAWQTVLHESKICASPANAHKLVTSLAANALSVRDIMRSDGQAYVIDFCNHFEKNDTVVFDTETTGVDALTDDIVQLSASRLSGGKIVANLNLFLHTDKPLPLIVGGNKNPLIDEYAQNPHLDPKEALLRFCEFAQGAVLIGHNSDFDYNIVDANLKRVGIDSFTSQFPIYYDTLRLARLLMPKMKSYRLGVLVNILKLQGTNSHLADEDVNATIELTRYCYAEIKRKLPQIKQFIAHQIMQQRNFEQSLVARLYCYLNKHLYDAQYPLRYGYRSALADAMCMIHRTLYGCMPDENTARVLRFFDLEVAADQWGASLVQQLNQCLFTLGSYSEVDLCGSSTTNERVVVATVHKAKGIEFENVIVTNVDDKMYPKAWSHDAREEAESARALYVALSRARKRLCLTYERQNRKNIDLHLSRFVAPHKQFFKIYKDNS